MSTLMTPTASSAQKVKGKVSPRSSLIKKSLNLISDNKSAVVESKQKFIKRIDNQQNIDATNTNQQLSNYQIKLNNINLAKKDDQQKIAICSRKHNFMDDGKSPRSDMNRIRQLAKLSPRQQAKKPRTIEQLKQKVRFQQSKKLQSPLKKAINSISSSSHLSTKKIIKSSRTQKIQPQSCKTLTKSEIAPPKMLPKRITPKQSFIKANQTFNSPLQKAVQNTPQSKGKKQSKQNFKLTKPPQLLNTSDDQFYQSLKEKVDSARASPKLGQLHDIKKLSIVKRWGTPTSTRKDIRKEIILNSDSERQQQSGFQTKGPKRNTYFNALLTRNVGNDKSRNRVIKQIKTDLVKKASNLSEISGQNDF